MYYVSWPHGRIDRFLGTRSGADAARRVVNEQAGFAPRLTRAAFRESLRGGGVSLPVSIDAHMWVSTTPTCGLPVSRGARGQGW
jgi:hypothetical protein